MNARIGSEYDVQLRATIRPKWGRGGAALALDCLL